jgi:hypothetical protein
MEWTLTYTAIIGDAVVHQETNTPQNFREFDLFALAV